VCNVYVLLVSLVITEWDESCVLVAGQGLGKKEVVYIFTCKYSARADERCMGWRLELQ
jgi:hypothetical protein